MGQHPGLTGVAFGMDPGSQQVDGQGWPGEEAAGTSSSQQRDEQGWQAWDRDRG